MNAAAMKQVALEPCAAQQQEIYMPQRESKFHRGTKFARVPQPAGEVVEQYVPSAKRILTGRVGLDLV